VILLRHTRPVGAEGLCYGRLDLLPGADLAAEVARLNDSLPEVARIVASPLTRCRLLGEGLARARGLALALEPRLVEMDFGAWEGRPWADVPRAELDAWAADLLHARPHGGESVAQLAARVEAALADLGARPGRALVVTHAGVIKAALVPRRGPAAWSASIGFGEALDMEGAP
jgi:alpha-ribazole phosphatase